MSDISPRRWTFRKIVAAISSPVGWTIAAIAGLATIYVAIFPPAPPPQPSLPPIVVNPSTENIGLSIIDANLQAKVEKRRVILWIVPYGTDNFYWFNISIRNTEKVAREACYIAAEYSGPNGRGTDTLFMGMWRDWYNKNNNISLFFSLPGDPTFAQTFFSSPSPVKLGRLDWARVRVVCQKPEMQISPWRSVDLSRARWE